MAHEGLHRHTSHEQKSHPVEEEELMTPEEMKKFHNGQRVLALVAYNYKHSIVTDLTTFPSRKDIVAQRVRHEAGLEWAQLQDNDSPPLAALYRNYWKSHKEDVLSLDLDSTQACLDLIEKMRRTPARIKRTLH